MAIDYEGLGEQYEEDQVERGGGGGGKKKKPEHQGKKTAQERTKNLVTQSRENAQEQQERHPEVSENENPSIDATILRLYGLDKESQGLPRLSAYFSWIVKIISDDEYREARDVRSECKLVLFRRSKGAGGQNVNKVSTAVRLEHVPTGISLQRYENRSQESNRKEVLEAARVLVERHIEEWIDYVTEGSQSSLEMMKERLDGVISKGVGDMEVGEEKRRALWAIKDVVLREK